MQPLSGYRILACENGLAGPLFFRLLADLGAELGEHTREVLEEVGLPEVEIGHLVSDGLPG